MRVLLVSVVLWFTTTAASAAIRIGDEIKVTAAGGSSVNITRSPLAISFQDPSGRTILGSQPGAGSAVVAPVPQQQFGTQSAPPPALYAPLSFLVGQQSIAQFPAQQWQGDLQSVTQTGIKYAATQVSDVRPDGAGVTMTLETTDPTGRTLTMKVAPRGRDGLRVSVRGDGIGALAASFATPAGEAFRGFGGRHDSLDQRGSEFYDWLQQENISSGSADGLTQQTDGETYMFPNGEHAAYYVQSAFVSPGRYGFVYDRSEPAHWRLASDLPDAWQVEAAGPALDYVVIPGDAREAIRGITAITGRQPLPPAWAQGTILDRLVQFPSDPPDQFLGEVRSDLADLHGVRLAAYRIEGWQFLPRSTLKQLIGELRSRGIHPMLYFRLFVGKDTIGTDAPAAFDEAVAKGYVATHADGSPYTYTSNFNADGAVIDYTNPAAISWWKGRITEALRLGADGFMQDFGEQVMADMHFHDGSDGVTMHNRLAVLAHRATREAVRAFERAHPKRRIWFFTRAGHNGAARYEGANFPGDETTDWTRSAGLASQTPDMLNRAIGGAYGFTTDIGGFFDVGPYQATTKELFIRWTEWAALSPFFRVHGSVGAGTHTPWSYGPETLRIFKRYATLHRRAAPLIRRLWREARRTGIPPTRPLWLAAPGDARAAAQDQEWMLGDDLIVAPVVIRAAVSRDVYLPAGCWQRDGRGRRLTGRRTVTAEAALGQLPWFVRCGTRPLA
ncbi:MAG: glycoside hydrolase family 31 [Solirubrobacterales bacterium]|nr:glycoside hydrolase family 31 [Solirubrobacterales bacterium]